MPRLQKARFMYVDKNVEFVLWRLLMGIPLQMKRKRDFTSSSMSSMLLAIPGDLCSEEEDEKNGFFFSPKIFRFTIWWLRNDILATTVFFKWIKILHLNTIKASVCMCVYQRLRLNHVNKKVIEQYFLGVSGEVVKIGSSIK